MSTYWEITNGESQLQEATYARYRDVIDLAIDSWDASVAQAYFKNFQQLALPCAIYKTQADVALRQAITSVLTREYAQAIYNLRLASESLVIAIYGYSASDALLEFFKMKGLIDNKVKKAANTHLAQKLPARSEKFKGLHQMCDIYGSHQGLSNAGRYVDTNEENFAIKLISDDSPQLTVGLIGIAVGLMLEFNFVMSELPVVEHVKIESESTTKMANVLDRFEDMKRKYRSLWSELI